MRITNNWWHLIAVFVFILLLVSCTTGRTNRKLRIIHAGSVSIPVKEIADSFMAIHPDVIIETEAWGSKAGARRVADLNSPCDVFISADYRVIDQILIPEHARWNIHFAGNEMALVYTGKSRYADEINSDNCFNILLRDDVLYSRSDPDSDPCGSRAVLCIKLSEKYYRVPSMANTLLSRHTEHIRPKETDLIALLEKNVVDYIFLYKSVAIQHGLHYVELPDEVNLRNPELDSLYQTVEVEVAGKTPDEKIVEKGESMVYGITIPLTATEKELAVEFAAYLLDPDKGQKIFLKHGQNSMVPAFSDTYKHIPDPLKKFAKNFR